MIYTQSKYLSSNILKHKTSKSSKFNCSYCILLSWYHDTNNNMPHIWFSWLVYSSKQYWFFNSIVNMHEFNQINHLDHHLKALNLFFKMMQKSTKLLYLLQIYIPILWQWFYTMIMDDTLCCNALLSQWIRATWIMTKYDCSRKFSSYLRIHTRPFAWTLVINTRTITSTNRIIDSLLPSVNSQM